MVGHIATLLMNHLTTSHPADSKRSSPSLLARQLRLRLVAGDDSDIPRNLHNIVVSIHAIATFQALHDYLRPRVSGLLSSGSRLSGMLAALAASGFGPGSSSRTATDELQQGSQSGPSTEGNSTANVGTSSVTAAPEPIPARRRSLRLNAKNASNSAMSDGQVPVGGDTESSTAENAATEPSGIPPSTMNEDVIDSGFAAEFTDDEVDADVRC
jgi:E3 ubiquitin-protein ligase TRIP12